MLVTIIHTFSFSQNGKNSRRLITTHHPHTNWTIFQPVFLQMDTRIAICQQCLTLNGLLNHEILITMYKNQNLVPMGSPIKLLPKYNFPPSIINKLFHICRQRLNNSTGFLSSRPWYLTNETNTYIMGFQKSTTLYVIRPMLIMFIVSVYILLSSRYKNNICRICCTLGGSRGKYSQICRFLFQILNCSSP